MTEDPLGVSWTTRVDLWAKGDESGPRTVVGTISAIDRVFTLHCHDAQFGIEELLGLGRLLVQLAERAPQSSAEGALNLVCAEMASPGVEGSDWTRPSGSD